LKDSFERARFAAALSQRQKNRGLQPLRGGRVAPEIIYEISSSDQWSITGGNH